MLAFRQFSYFRTRSFRQFNNSAVRRGAYEGDGKTTVTILNKEANFGVMIDAYSLHGFRLNNGMFVVGPMALFPKTALSWNVTGDHEIHSRSLGLFALIEPKIDILVIGYGRTAKPLVQSEVHKFRVNKKINIEILPVEKAIPTFNYLCSEGRWVAGAFIPPMTVSNREDEMAAEKLRKTELF